METMEMKNSLTTCPTHLGRNLIYVCTNPSQSNIMKCERCIIEDQVQYNHLIPISQIIECETKTLFHNWPLQNDMDDISEINVIFTKIPTDVKLKEKINEYFKGLRSQINDKIDSLATEMMKKAEDIWMLNEKVVEQYNQLTQKNEIKSLINDDNLSYDSKNSKLQELIGQIVQNQLPNKEAIQKSIANLKLHEEAIDFSKPTQIQTQVLEFIQEIDFFLPENPENENNQQFEGKDIIKAIIDLVGNPFNKCSPVFLKNLEDHLKQYQIVMKKFHSESVRINDFIPLALDKLNPQDIEEIIDITRIYINNKDQIEEIHPEQSQVDQLMELAKNKFNFCSGEYLERLEEHLQKYKTLLNAFEFPIAREQDWVPVRFEELDDLDVQEINSMAKQMIENKVHDREVQDNIQMNTLVDYITKLVSNKFNFCSDDYLMKVGKMFRGISRYINSFLIEETNVNRQKQQACQNLSQQQVLNISALINKINDLSDQHGDNYRNLQSPQTEIQKSSTILSKLIQNHLITSKQQVNELNKMLVNFPIFDTINLISNQQTLSMPFIKTNYEKSQELIIDNDESGYQITYPNTGFNCAAVSRFALDNNLVYIIRCTFNKPFNCSQGNIRIGLLEESQINIGFPNSDGSSGFMVNSDMGQILRRGDNLSCESLRSTITCLEFRICVESQQFYFADYPDYNNINSIPSNKFIYNKKYHFGICFQSENTDWRVKFHDITILQDKSQLTKYI